jgi:hypothetical protein
MIYRGMHLKNHNEIPWPAFEKYRNEIIPGMHLKSCNEIPWHTFEKWQ